MLSAKKAFIKTWSNQSIKFAPKTNLEFFFDKKTIRFLGFDYLRET